MLAGSSPGHAEAPWNRHLFGDLLAATISLALLIAALPIPVLDRRRD